LESNSASSTSAETAKETIKVAGILEDGPIRKLLKERIFLKQGPEEWLTPGKLSLFIEGLKKDIDDEREASTHYSIMAGVLGKMGLLPEKAYVDAIARQEHEHMETLQGIVCNLEEKRRRM
jgi:hypothetical protein